MEYLFTEFDYQSQFDFDWNNCAAFQSTSEVSFDGSSEYSRSLFIDEFFLKDEHEFIPDFFSETEFMSSFNTDNSSVSKCTKKTKIE
mmetsp:Transcript_8242/g.14913  ORF Transcript_8242/g.14913 Transcript_8242/m.14913 type:complete len:87 (-) Transcript_8242:369-629(-)